MMYDNVIFGDVKRNRGVAVKVCLSNCVPTGIPTPGCCICKGNSTLIAGQVNVTVVRSSDSRSNNILG